MEQNETTSPLSHIGPLDKKERRVLGVLIEKALTTPEYYPLTLKALTTGCNQKNNRSPLANYDEYDLEETIDKLRSRGLLASVQTAGGRTERYRHLLRDQTGWGQKPLAIMAELLLRGRQQTGELRTRASRMAALESLDELREELEKLMSSGYVQSNGELQRRGIEVDHLLYHATENKTLDYQAAPPETARTETASDTGEETGTPATSRPRTAPAQEVLELQEKVEELQATVLSLSERIAEIERQLGI